MCKQRLQGYSHLVSVNRSDDDGTVTDTDNGETGTMLDNRYSEQQTRCNCSCSANSWKRKLPITRWLPNYKLNYLQGDIIAGITIALTLIPQSIAYASGIADLEPQYGLYTSIMGPFAYCLFGTARDISYGPTAIMSLLTAKYGTSFVHGDVTVAAALALMCGIIQLIFGILHMGIIANYISHPVVSSFTTAAGITIAFSQLKNLLGLTNIPHDFLQQLYAIIVNLSHTKLWDLGLGTVCMLLLFALKNLKDIKLFDAPYSNLVPWQRVLVKFVWLLSIARNVLTVVTAIIVVKLLNSYNIHLFTLSPPVFSGLPPLRLPTFHMTVGNVTYGPTDFFSRMELGLIVVPLVGIVENIAISKEFGRKNGYTVDQSQEIIAIGMTNILGSFIGAYPAAASFSRSSLMSQSGVRTCLVGVVTGSFVLLALVVITPLFSYIPNCVLAAVIMMACWDLVDFRIVRSMWRENRSDVLPWMATLVVGLCAGIEYGLFVGISITFIFLLYPWYAQHVDRRTHTSVGNLITRSEEGVDNNDIVCNNDNVVSDKRQHKMSIGVLKFSQSIYFPGVDDVRNTIISYANEIRAAANNDGDVAISTSPSALLLDMSHVRSLDYSAIEELRLVNNELRTLNILLAFTNVNSDVLRKLKQANLPHFEYYNDNEDGLHHYYSKYTCAI